MSTAPTLQEIYTKSKVIGQANPSPPEFGSKQDIAKAIQAGLTVSEQRKQLESNVKAAAEALEKAEIDYRAAVTEVNDQRAKLVQIENRATRARAMAIGSEVPREETALTERGLKLMSQSAELRTRYGLHQVKPIKPEDTEDARHLANLLSEQVELEKAINRNQKAASGTTGPEHRLRKVVKEIAELEPKVAKYAQSHERYAEILALKKQSDDCFAERDRMRHEREQAIINEMLASFS